MLFLVRVVGTIIAVVVASNPFGRAEKPMVEFARSTIDDTDLAKYDRLGEEWWDEKGPMGALHKFNPVRVGWIRDLLAREMPKDGSEPARPLAGYRLLDVGSGGGILCESLARLGADMVGIDPAPNNIAVSTRHANLEGLKVAYHCTTVETLVPLGERYDAVLVMEVIEHVKDVAGFLRDASRMVKPGGLLIGATLNRTMKSYALGIVGAEYVLRWLPVGTHDWNKFVTPDEFEGHLVRAGLKPLARAGVSFNPLRNRWHLSKDLGCNYMLATKRPAG